MSKEHGWTGAVAPFGLRWMRNFDLSVVELGKGNLPERKAFLSNFRAITRLKQCKVTL
jgi:hypothetical protein